MLIITLNDIATWQSQLTGCVDLSGYVLEETPSTSAVSMGIAISIILSFSWFSIFFSLAVVGIIMKVIVNILYMLEMLRWIDSSDHLRRSIVPGKNNLSGILWMWNPLMRFLLFLHYTHIVSARWGPVLVRAGPGLALWGVITKQDPVLNSPSWGISFGIKDQYWGQQRVQHRTHLASNR